MQTGIYVNEGGRYVRVYNVSHGVFKGTHIRIMETDALTQRLQGVRLTNATTQEQLELQIMEFLFLLEYHISERDEYENNKS